MFAPSRNKSHLNTPQTPISTSFKTKRQRPIIKGNAVLLVPTSALTFAQSPPSPPIQSIGIQRLLSTPSNEGYTTKAHPLHPSSHRCTRRHPRQSICKQRRQSIPSNERITTQSNQSSTTKAHPFPPLNTPLYA